MLSLSVNEYIEKLSSSSSTPSGGSTVGIIAALASSLGMMAINVSKESKKNKLINDEDRENIEKLITKLNKSIENFKFLSLQDATVFNEYMKAKKEDKLLKMTECLNVPFSCAKECVKTIILLDKLTKYISSNIVSDMMLSFILLEACFKGSLINVAINEKWINDEKISKEVKRFIINNEDKVKILVNNNLSYLGGMM